MYRCFLCDDERSHREKVTFAEPVTRDAIFTFVGCRVVESDVTNTSNGATLSQQQQNSENRPRGAISSQPTLSDQHHLPRISVVHESDALSTSSDESASPSQN